MKHSPSRIVPMDYDDSSFSHVRPLVFKFAVAAALGAVTLHHLALSKQNAHSNVSSAPPIDPFAKWNRCLLQAADKVSSMGLSQSESGKVWDEEANRCTVHVRYISR